MYVPGALLTAVVNPTTSAAGNASPTIVAAPGAGFRVRVWAFSLALEHDDTTTLRGECELRNAAGLTVQAVVAVADDQRFAEHHFDGGFAFAENMGVGLAIRVAPGAAVLVWATVDYTIESV